MTTGARTVAFIVVHFSSFIEICHKKTVITLRGDDRVFTLAYIKQILSAETPANNGSHQWVALPMLKLFHRGHLLSDIFLL